MKKTALLLILSTTSLAWGEYGQRGGGGCVGYSFWGRMSNGWHHMTGRGYNDTRRNLEDERYYLETREKNAEIYNKYGIEINKKTIRRRERITGRKT